MKTFLRLMEESRNDHDSKDAASKIDLHSGTVGKLLLHAIFSSKLNKHLAEKRTKAKPAG